MSTVMEQLAFFGPPEQRTEQERVSATIADVVLAFCRAIYRTKEREFRAAQLRQYVAACELTAPASPDRILRLLRQRGLVSYEVTDRRGSLYKVTAVTP